MKRRPDLSDRLLVGLIAAAVASLAVYYLVQPNLAEPWHRPGSTALHLTAVAGSMLLLVAAAFVAVKRAGAGRPPMPWFIAHVVGGTVGAVLVAIHASGRIFETPGLLLLALAGLVALGVWARVNLASRMAGTFGSKRGAFRASDPALRETMAALLAEKRRILADLDPKAQEATFSVTPRHWLSRPGAALAYARLVRREEALTGARASVGKLQAWWRAMHLALAAAFVLGLITHIVVVTFFAGYASDGQEIYWWHVTDW